MAQEPVVLEDATGQSRPGRAADIARYSDAMRITIGTLYIVGGLVGGTVCLVVPVAHLITTWALPLGGIFMGIRAFKRRVVIYQVAGVCPTCGEAIDLHGGSIDDPSWQTCPKCNAVLRVRPGLTQASAPTALVESGPSAAVEPGIG
jgi:hypothetical protein